MPRARILLAALVVALSPFSANAATMASFDTEVGVSVSATPGQEVWAGYGYLPGPSIIIQNGDTTLTTGDDNGTDTCCFGPFPVSTTPMNLGTAALDAQAGVNSTGEVLAAGLRLSTWFFGNSGNQAEALTVDFAIEMAIAQAIDPLIGGIAGSATAVVIEQDGVEIYSESLASLIDELALGAATFDLFTVNVNLNPGDFPQFSVAIGGAVYAAVPAPVPLPAGLLLLVSAMGALALWRRRSA